MKSNLSTIKILSFYQMGLAWFAFFFFKSKRKGKPTVKEKEFCRRLVLDVGFMVGPQVKMVEILHVLEPAWVPFLSSTFFFQKEKEKEEKRTSAGKDIEFPLHFYHANRNL